jgi:hypothetical protein
MVRKSKLAFKESIADLWGWPDCDIPKRPSTKVLFEAIAGEALACLSHADWETRIRRIENILSVLKWRISVFWEGQLDGELDRLVREAKEEVRTC